MALVIGPSLEYAWLLSRNPTPSAELCQRYFSSAETIGIEPNAWIQIRNCKNSE